MPAEARIADLRKVPMFSDFSRPELELLAAHVDEAHFPVGDTVIAEGASNDRFFMILDGQTEIRIGGRLRKTLGPGDIFGEISLHTGGITTAQVVARTALRTMVITQVSYAVLRDHPVSAARIVRTITERIAANRLAR